jgi:hypothetical protein
VNGTNAGGSDWLGTPVLFLFQTNTDMIIADNIIERSGVNTGNVVYEGGPTTPPSYIVFKNNTLIQAVAGNIFQIESCDHLIIDGNTLRNTSANAGASLAVNLRALTRSCPRLTVVNNVLESTVKMLTFLGVSAGGSSQGVVTVSDITIANNNAGNVCTRGVHFDASAADGSAVDAYPILQGNNFRGATNPWVVQSCGWRRLSDCLAESWRCLPDGWHGAPRRGGDGCTGLPLYLATWRLYAGFLQVYRNRQYRLVNGASCSITFKKVI